MDLLRKIKLPPYQVEKSRALSKVDLPPEIVMEILSRLPLYQVGKSRALSKAYAKATYKAYYKDLHVKRQVGPVLDGFLIHELYGRRRAFFSSPQRTFLLSPSFLPCNSFVIEIQAVAPNGLLVCDIQCVPSIYCICKPTTKQWKAMPRPINRNSAGATAISLVNHRKLHFKVVRFTRKKRLLEQHLPYTNDYTCELFDSNAWRWNQLPDVVLLRSCIIIPRSVAVYASGSAHWLLSDGTILAFHFHSQDRSIIAVPPNPKSLKVKLADYEGKLAVMRQLQQVGKKDSTELWVYDNGVWTPKLDLAMKMPLAFYSSDVALSRDYIKLKFYNFVHGTATSVDDRRLCPDHRVFRFSSDYEPCNFLEDLDSVPPTPTSTMLAIKNILRMLLLFSFVLALRFLGALICDRL